MSLIILFLLRLFNSSKEQKSCQIYGKQTKNHGYGFNDKKNFYCVYLDTNEFNPFEEIIIELYVQFLKTGHFDEDLMYYG